MLKKLTILVFIISLSFHYNATSQETTAKVKWYSMQEALELNKTNPKKFFIDVYTDWCHYCKLMDQNTFSDTAVAKYLNQHYYPVKFNAEGKDTIRFADRVFVNQNSGGRSPHDFAVALLQGKLSYPSVAFLNEQNQMLTVVPGYRTPDQVSPILVFLAEDHYKTISFDDFMKTYKGISK